MSAERTRKAAYRHVAHAINDWLSTYAESKAERVDPLVLVEMERIRDSMLAAGAVPVANGANGTAG